MWRDIDMDFAEWLKSGTYLPEPMRDFHDQKRLFQIVGEMVTRRQAKERDSYDRALSDLPNWVSAHIYVVDFFLWFMATRGYTLQRSRKPFEFVNLDSDVSAFEERKAEMFRMELAELKRENQLNGAA
jgi:hypothetical protein